MKMGGSDLVSPTDRKPDSPPKAKASHDQPRSDKVLLLTVVLPILKECRVELNLRPELPKYPVLESVIPDVGSSDNVGISNWKPNPEGTLEVEVPQSFSVGDRRRNHRVRRSIFVVPRRQAPTQERRKNVVTVLLVF